jgi:hypothetical protein
MERMGPESLMLMAAAPISYRAAVDDRRLWELPMEDERREPTLLAASPLLAAPARPAGPRRLLAWLHLPRGAVEAAEF